MKVEIFQEVKSATQSGKGRSKKWVVMPIIDLSSKVCNPLMGWIGSNNPSAQLRFIFDSQEKATSFAKSKGYEYVIKDSIVKKIIPKSYSENFTR